MRGKRRIDQDESEDHDVLHLEDPDQRMMDQRMRSKRKMETAFQRTPR